MKVKGYSFIDAVNLIIDKTTIQRPFIYKNAEQNEIKNELVLPEKADNFCKAKAYLIKRGIDSEIIDECIKNNLIYEEKNYHNVVFVGYDKNKKARYAFVRGTNENRFMKEAKGSNKNFTFRLNSKTKSNRLHLFESCIDLLSYATLMKLKNLDFHKENLLSLAGVFKSNQNKNNLKMPTVLEKYLKENPNINEIHLHLDNDEVGRFASENLKQILSKNYKVIDSPTPKEKDCNDSNKAIVGTQKIKNRVYEAKEKVRENTEKEENVSGTTYAVNKVSNQIKNTPYTIKKLNQANNYGKENFTKTKENIRFAEQKIQYAQKRSHAQKVAKNMIRGRNAIVNENAISTTEDVVKESRIKIKGTANSNTIKLVKGRNSNIIKTTETTSKKAIKTAENTSKNAVKISKKAQRNANRAVKASKRTMQIAKETAKKTSRGIKLAIKATVSSVKAIIAGTKALITAIIAGGWIVIVVVVVICLIAMLCSSIFGIFFSSENIGSSILVNGVAEPITMNRVVNDLNKEFMNKITTIQLENPYDEYDITGGRTNWKDVLAVYTVKLSGGNDKVEVMTLDNNKINTIKEIFWTMNDVNFTKETEIHEEVIEIWDKTGSKTVTKTVTYTKLHINITTKDAYEMARLYDFTPAQNRQLEELLKDDYSKMWSAVIYGSSGSNDIVAVALSQLGNVGGQPYWSWYGFPSRVEWCACFVSYCANECGYIESGIIPKFASCESEGVTWFKACGLWQDGGHTPKPGDIIFFDWKDKHDGHSDHVGIVEKVENGRVYTVEGNSNDSCRQRDYDLNSTEIQGYGTPMY